MNKFSERRQQMFCLVESFPESMLTRVAFCQQHNIPLSRFQYWQKKYHESLNTAPAGFVRLLSPDRKAGSTVPAAMVLQYPSGVSLQLPAGISLSTLRALLSLI